jgi:peptidoglycan/LPS O-acetylase OafA/YrhL
MTETNQSPYLPALDGIRAICIILVFAGHQGFENLIPGGLGVTIFFFLSGYLITNLLFTEYRKAGRISLRNFYLRRLLRLYPALLFMLSVFTLYLTCTGQSFSGSELVASLFYFENYHRLFINPSADEFWILWSLAIEEHFYLVFPFLFAAFFKKPKTLIVLTVALVLLSLLLRIYTSLAYNMSYFSEMSTAYLTHNRFDSILTGCLTSMLLHQGSKEKLLRLASDYRVYFFALAVLLFTVVYRDVFFRQTVRYSLQGFSLMVLVPSILYARKYAVLNRVFSTPALVFVGKLSYSVYLFHWVSLSVFSDLGFAPGSVVWVAGNVVLTLALSLISYYGVEQRFLRLRHRFGSMHKGGAATGRQRTVIALLNKEGQQASL